MRTRSACLALLVLAGQAFAAGPAAKLNRLACETGPLAKTYGGVSWLVYGCADQRSILVVSHSETSEYIMLSPLRDGVQVISEGWSQGSAGNAAFAELKGMTAKQLIELAVETRHSSH